MNKFLLLFSTLIHLVFSSVYDYSSSNDLVLNWNQEIDYTFDVNEHCISKCYSTDVLNITWDNNVVDYYDYIQGALYEIAVNGGGALFLSKGTYILSDHLTIPLSNICIVGESRDDTILQLENQAVAFDQSGFIRTLGNENITLSDISLDGNRLNQIGGDIYSYGRYGFYSELTKYQLLNNVKITSFEGYGFDPHGNKKDWAEYLAIVNCYSSLNGIDGFTLDQTKYITFYNNEATNNDRHGVNIVTGSQNGTISNNKISKNGYISTLGCGITVQNNDEFFTSYWNLTNNEMVDNFNDDFCIRNSSDINMSKNTIYKDSSLNLTSFCFWVEGSTNIFIYDNFCYTDNFLNNKDNTNLQEFNNVKRANSIPDPTCANGLVNKNICCNINCLTCGGTSCSTDPLGSNNCCTNTILTSQYSCNDYSSPCIIGYIPTVTIPPVVTTPPTVPVVTEPPTVPVVTEPPTIPVVTEPPTIPVVTEPPTVPVETTVPTVPVETIAPTVPVETTAPTVPESNVDSSSTSSFAPTISPSFAPTISPEFTPEPTPEPTLTNSASSFVNISMLNSLFFIIVFLIV